MTHFLYGRDLFDCDRPIQKAWGEYLDQIIELADTAVRKREVARIANAWIFYKIKGEITCNRDVDSQMSVKLTRLLSPLLNS